MSSIRSKQLRLVVYPNDHPPPHTHVIGPGWEIRIELSLPPTLMSIGGKPKSSEIAAALLCASERLSELRALWSDLHD